jgi:O-antigen/teichoic acid export membrane protein
VSGAAATEGPTGGAEVESPDDAAPARRIWKLLGRGSWNLLDQMLSALTNVVLGIVITWTGGKIAFGAFGVAFLIFSLLIAIERALVGLVLGIRHSNLSREEMRSVAATGLGTVLSLGVLSGLLCMVSGLLIGGIVGPALVAVGVCMAPLIMQDTCRMVFFALARPALAALNDAVWAVVQFTAIALLASGGVKDPASLIGAWGGAALVCVVLALIQLRVVPRPFAAWEWCRHHRDLVGYLLPETLLTSGGLNVSTLLAGRLVGLEGIAALRGGQLLLGPLGIVSSSAVTFVVPELSRRTTMSATSLRRAALAISGAMAVVSLTYLGLLLVVPDAAGTWLFRDNWTAARSVLVPLGVFSTAAAISTGPALVVIAMGNARQLLRITALQTPLLLLLMPLGAALGGAPGAAWGQVAAGTVPVPFWFRALQRAIDGRVEGGSAPSLPTG